MKQTGQILGLKLGLVSSFLYLIGFIAFFNVDAFRFSRSLADFVFGLLVTLPVSLIVGAIIGVLPAMIIGWATGFLLGMVVEKQPDVMSNATAFLVGCALCGLIAILFNVVSLVSFGYDNASFLGDGMYWMLIGLPSLVYIITGGWLMQRLQRAKRQ
jgi:tetrahydromethanopterin S-methyltransferase subunit C